MASLGKFSTCDEVTRAFAQQALAIRNATVIVTGGNSGIGKVTAKALATLGARVVIAARDAQRGEDTVKDIATTDGKVSFIPLDLASFESVHAFAETYTQKSKAENWPPLSILVLNAGVYPIGGHRFCEKGFEHCFSTNHLGHFLLTKLLLPHLRQSPVRARVVVVSSIAHRGGFKQIADPEKLMDKVVLCSPKDFDTGRVYACSKLCNVLFASKLHQLEAHKTNPEGVPGVVACSLHPGSMIGTSIARGNFLANFALKYIMSWWTKSLDQGASTTLMCCLMPPEQLQGRYFSDCEVTPASTLSQDQSAQDTLWSVSEKLISGRSKL